jgi:HAE1 family hydrophobic/amphiphilic exporter-1
VSAARLRRRPSLMTADACVLGCVPVWSATGAGAISRRVLGSAVIGGMLAASLLAIFLIPVSFDVVERLAHRGKKKAEPPASKPVARPKAVA